MVGYSDSLSANMENSRNTLRRIARHDDTEFSKDSIVNSMEKFVKTVNAMYETVLVPCRLMDLKVSETAAPGSEPAGGGRRANRDALASEDLFALYNILNAAKVELLWGGRDHEAKEQQQQQQQPRTSVVQAPAAAASQAKKGHARRPSTASTASTASSASLPSDTDSEVGVEVGSEDSGVDNDDCETGGGALGAERTAANFRRHLSGLRRALAGLTEAADALTQRYQADVGAPV